MILAGAPLADIPLASLLRDPGKITDATALNPLTFDHKGVRIYPLVESLEISDTLGQPVSASFLLPSPSSIPIEGEEITIRFYSQIIFAGQIDRVRRSTSGLAVLFYECRCLDWSQSLIRRTVRRNFTNLPIEGILDSILDNELAGELLTIGSIDNHASIPLVDSNGARVFDVCRSMGGATGQTFYVDFDKSIHMLSISSHPSPIPFSESQVEVAGTILDTDRETYRNKQMVVVTGTAPQGGEANTITIERSNPNQIAARQAIEGGSGIYDAIEEITHPTSNDPVQLALLGISFANLKLATSGTLRQTLSCVVRGYGFRAGQIATVTLPSFGVVGTFVIQRVSINVQGGISLVHRMELTSSSLQARAFEAWLTMVGAGKVTVQSPAAITSNLVIFDTPGADTWTVPAGVTIAEFRASGGSGGGGAQFNGQLFSCLKGHGGRGGHSGLAITIRDVTPGQVYDIVVGSAGLAGTPPGAGSCTLGTNGTAGGHSSVKLGAVTVSQGNGGGGGVRGSSGVNGAAGADGSGVGDGVSVGGGKLGGNGGIGLDVAVNPAGTNPTNGLDGLVEIRW